MFVLIADGLPAGPRHLQSPGLRPHGAGATTTQSGSGEPHRHDDRCVVNILQISCQEKENRIEVRSLRRARKKVPRQ